MGATHATTSDATAALQQEAQAALQVVANTSGTPANTPPADGRPVRFVIKKRPHASMATCPSAACPNQRSCCVNDGPHPELSAAGSSSPPGEGKRQKRSVVAAQLYCGHENAGHSEVASWLPAFPPRHTFSVTPDWPPSSMDSQASQRKRTQCRRDVERSLVGLRTMVASSNGQSSPSHRGAAGAESTMMNRPGTGDCMGPLSAINAMAMRCRPAIHDGLWHTLQIPYVDRVTRGVAGSKYAEAGSGRGLAVNDAERHPAQENAPGNSALHRPRSGLVLKLKKPAEAPRVNSSAEKQSNNRQSCESVALGESDGAVRQKLLRLLEAVKSETAPGGSITHCPSTAAELVDTHIPFMFLIHVCVRMGRTTMELCSGVCRSSSRGNTGVLRNDNTANVSPHDISMRRGAKVCDRCTC
jgi:hypothetical protein